MVAIVGFEKRGYEWILEEYDGMVVVRELAPLKIGTKFVPKKASTTLTKQPCRHNSRL